MTGAIGMMFGNQTPPVVSGGGGGGGGGGGSDANWSDVQILLRGGGTGSTIVDSSNNNFSFTNVGSPVYSSTRAKWASTSIALLSNATLTKTYVSELNLNNDFTIEFWCYLDSGAGALVGAFLFGRILIFPDLYCEMGNGSSVIGSAGASEGISTGVWTHIAITRATNTVRVFKNGTQVSTYSTSTAETSQTLEIGGFNGENKMNGYIEDFRWTKGVARYTANFSAPAAQFPNS